MAQRNVRTFTLQRDRDESGVSGTGTVAEGVEFSSGQVVITWLSYFPAVNVYGSMKVCTSLHGHGSATRVVWDDETKPSPVTHTRAPARKGARKSKA